MAMTWKETKEYIKRDVYRNLGACSGKLIVKNFVSGASTTGFLIHYRLCHYFAGLERKNFVQFVLHAVVYLRFCRRQERCGIELNQRTEIGYGLRLPHKGNIVIHPLARIGNNCEIMQGVTIGNNIMKDRDAVAVIGNEVMLCAGSKIIGGITIGNTVVVGANAVVNRDVTDHVIVGGIPARVIGECDDRFVINKKRVECEL